MHFEPMELDDGAVVSWYARRLCASRPLFGGYLFAAGASEPALLARPAFGRREVATPRKSCSSDGTSEHEDSDVSSSSSSLVSARLPGCHKDRAAAQAHPRRRRRVPQQPDGRQGTEQNGPAQPSAPEMTSAGDEQMPPSHGGSVSRPLRLHPCLATAGCEFGLSRPHRAAS